MAWDFETQAAYQAKLDPAQAALAEYLVREVGT